MPPKKIKGKKRVAEEENGDEVGEQDEKPNESTELLSPSEVVKMRKKTRPAAAVNAAQNSVDTKSEKSKSKQNRASSADKSTDKKAKTKENADKKDKTKTGKRENAEEKKSRNYRERRRPISKKKSHSEESGDEESNDIMYPCGICMKEVSDADEAILCEAGCEFWYHRNCTGMTDIAYQFLTNEENCEWVCDKCIATKAVPLVKVKMQAAI